ncbi:hypothetical protein HALLA_01250 (plasmid) [Halostagnicola larsenii XH-48]|uniref:alpha-L-fucosidase n=2 Tax=Halostagnicola larsenii TaxID=353800 RepID=W0JY70_9EURY|nr:hypothetical protein HALLA_01250 [Halostagnicola larsenii XH-48]
MPATAGPPRSAPDDFEAFEKRVDETVSNVRSVVDDGPFEPDWDSLANVTHVPEWFRDGKFGIFCHWGPYSAPAYAHEWYPRQMYNLDNSINDYHIETYGEPDSHPYQEFIPEFTAEAFDAAEWADLFDRAGAKYAGPVVEHHDGWSLWDSDVSPWNAVDTGPERNLTGELESAIRDRGMRFVTTFHHSYNLIGEDGYFSFAYENYESVTEGYPDRVMYGNLPEALQYDTWLAKLAEVISGYQPDFVWFDWGLPDIPEEYQQRFLAYYHNQATEWDRDVVTTNKHDVLPMDVSVADFELGRPREMQEQAWNAEFKVADEGGWGYVEDRTFHSATHLVHVLIDIVSKNGQLLLSIGPRVDGTIEQTERDRLIAIGEWLETNGDAIYETRPWDAFGEGPTRVEAGGEFIGDVEYGPEDVRYTRSKDGDTVYAIVMGWPGPGEFAFEGMEVCNPTNAPFTPPGHGGTPPGHGVPSPEHCAGPSEQSRKPTEHGDAFRTDAETADTPDDIPPKRGATPPSNSPYAVRLLGHGPVPYYVSDDNHPTVVVPDVPESDRPSDIAIVVALEDIDLQPTEAAHE